MRLRTLSGAIPTPAAGAGFAYVFSPNERVKVESLIFTFSTSIVVANRLVWVQVLDPNNVPVFETGSATAIAASGASDFVLSPLFGLPSAMQGKTRAAVGLALPGFWLPPGWQLQVGAIAQDVGDTFTGITFAAHFSEDQWSKNEDDAALVALLQSLAT